MPGYSGPDEMNEIIANGLLLLLQEARELSHILEVFEPVHELYAFIRFSLADYAVFVDLRPEFIQKLLPCWVIVHGEIFRGLLYGVLRSVLGVDGGPDLSLLKIRRVQEARHVAELKNPNSVFSEIVSCLPLSEIDLRSGSDIRWSSLLRSVAAL